MTRPPWLKEVKVMIKPDVESFFDTDTNTFTYIVACPQTQRCAVIDSVADFDQPDGRVRYDSADRVIARITERGLTADWVLESHVHADHLSAAPYVRREIGGRMGIGSEIISVQEIFGKVFNAGPDFPRDGRQFDQLFEDGDTFTIGEVQCRAIHTPGHTPACMSYVIGDAVFVGDTLFMPDFGTARCDFPGGSAETLYDSVQKLFALPPETRMFMCHDYLPDGGTRDAFCNETTVGEQREKNYQLNAQTGRDEFVVMRNKRDEGNSAPRLLYPSVQVNMRAGHMPDAEDNGTAYLKIPLSGQQG
ncbi:MAG: MBL fold metallo-hydrolase [Pseudomonadota bacterium]